MSKEELTGQREEGAPNAKTDAGRAGADLPEPYQGFVTEGEDRALAAAADVIAKVLARYSEAAIEAGRRTDCAPSVTLCVNRAGYGWVINARRRDEASGRTLEAALRNHSGQTEAEQMRREAHALRAKAEELERRAAGMEYREKNAENLTLNTQGWANPIDALTERKRP